MPLTRRRAGRQHAFYLLIALSLLVPMVQVRSATAFAFGTPATTYVSVPSVTASPGSVAPGSTVSFTASVSSSSSMSNMIVDFEVFDASLNRLYQTYQSGVNLNANTSQSFTASWSVPTNEAAGTYYVYAGVFDGWWSWRYAWTHSTFTVAGSSPPPSSSPIALGVWIPGDLWNPSVVDSFTSMVGTAPKIVMWYQDWVNDGGFHTDAMKAYAARGAMPVVSWLPDTSGSSANFDRAVANGNYDGFLHSWAQAAAAWGKPFYLRFAPEMNGTWETFAPGVNGNTAADVVAMWQHVHDLFVHDGATNVRWVWCPNMESYGQTPYAAVYPGDAYVDWVGVDGYNWGHYDQWHWWTSLHDLFAPSYNDLTALTNKPIMIGETSSTDNGGDKAGWITQGFLTDIPASFPRIRAVVWFDEDKEVDWRVNSSSASLAAYQQVAASPLYQGQLP